MSTRLERPNRARIVREIALTVGAVAGLLCIVATVAAVLLGATPLIFRSGSMEPTIPTGALALTRSTPAAEVNAGDIISVENQHGVRVTHRVVSVDTVAGDAAALTLQGDANPEPDAQSYVVTSAERVVFHVNGLGYALSWLNSPAALVLGGLAVAGLVWIIIWPYGRRRSAGDDDSPRPAKDEGTHSITPLVILGVAATMVLGLGNVPGTAAAFTDSATANTGSFASRAQF
ncbi:MAG: signal peptidase I, partial [Rhodococcus sp. (in: high G+C Gram-positive bacteria)]|uniref:signal peptidase I n=1 Tax=Rhodococcus sp. TaxID=1831 RepID=UPI003BAE94B4